MFENSLQHEHSHSRLGWCQITASTHLTWSGHGLHQYKQLSNTIAPFQVWHLVLDNYFIFQKYVYFWFSGC